MKKNKIINLKNKIIYNEMYNLMCKLEIEEEISLEIFYLISESEIETSEIEITETSEIEIEISGPFSESVYYDKLYKLIS